MAKLNFVLEDGQEITVPLAEHITIGRAEDNDVVVDDDRVSKRHAELVRNADGSVQLFDTNSTAGTFVNGERVRSQTVRHGDTLAFGPLTAVLDLADDDVSREIPPPALSGSDTQAMTSSGTPVKATRVGPRKKGRSGKKDFSADTQAVLPAKALLEHQETAARLRAEKALLLEELHTVQDDLRSWQAQADKERASHHARVEALRAEEERLAPARAAVQEAEARHNEWIKSIHELAVQHEESTAALQRLAEQHDQKAAAVQQLHGDAAAARRELEDLATHRKEALAHLQQIRTDSAHEEAALSELRRQVAELEARSQQNKEVADVRADQLKTAEKKLDQLSHQRAQIEAHIHELSGTEEKLKQVLAQCREAEARHAALTTAVAALGEEQQRATAALKDLDFRISELQKSRQQAISATEEALAAQQRAENALGQIQREIAARTEELSGRNAELAAATQKLEEIQAHRIELDRQCQELAGTSQKLAGAKSALADAEQQLRTIKGIITADEARIAGQKNVLQALAAEESATKGRIEVLHARENDLRAELTRLSTAERGHRARFEEVRQLSTEAENAHAVQRQQLASSLESARNELADLLSRLQPLRDWKEAMDLLYARLAMLPQDSAEARELWREIEREKAGLHDLITKARTQAHAEVIETPRVGTRAIVSPENRRPSLPGGSQAPGTAQETTLRSRLSHLRETVQREESRLEQLRIERARHEPSHRPAHAAEAIMREQSRHLETKLRQEQERHHALLHSIEVSQAEEEKRRERLAELEHRLAEVRADITEAERQRSDLRQQADLAHTELKNFEAAIDRLARKTAD